MSLRSPPGTRLQLAAATLLVVLGGCTGGPPVVLKGNDSFVTVSQPDHTRKAAVNEVAHDYCAAYAKRAVFLSDACPEATCTQKAITYWCR